MVVHRGIDDAVAVTVQRDGHDEPGDLDHFAAGRQLDVVECGAGANVHAHDSDAGDGQVGVGHGPILVHGARLDGDAPVTLVVLEEIHRAQATGGELGGRVADERRLQEVRGPVPIGVCEGGIGLALPRVDDAVAVGVFEAVGDGVAVAVRVVGVRHHDELLTVGAAVAVAVGHRRVRLPQPRLVHAVSIGVLEAVGEPVTVGVGLVALGIDARLVQAVAAHLDGVGETVTIAVGVQRITLAGILNAVSVHIFDRVRKPVTVGVQPDEPAHLVGRTHVGARASVHAGPTVIVEAWSASGRTDQTQAEETHPNRAR